MFFRKKPIPEELKETVIPPELQKTVMKNSSEELAKTAISRSENVNLNYFIETAGKPSVNKKAKEKKSIEAEDLLEMIEALQEEVKHLRKQIKTINEKID